MKKPIEEKPIEQPEEPCPPEVARALGLLFDALLRMRTRNAAREKLRLALAAGAG